MSSSNAVVRPSITRISEECVVSGIFLYKCMLFSIYMRLPVSILLWNMWTLEGDKLHSHVKREEHKFV